MYKLFSVLLVSILLPLSVCSKEIGNVELLKAVENEFAEQGIANTVELEIFGGKTNFEVKDTGNVKILISNLITDSDNNKFTSTAEIFAGGVSVEKTELLGRFFVMKEVYVPSRDIAKGEIIETKDLNLVLMRENRLKNDSVVELDQIVSKQATKLLKADKLISERDLREEVIVKKGQEVTVLYKNKGLQITSKMQATEDGGKGSFIKFVNTKSAKEVVAKIIDKDTAEIKAE